MTTDADYAYSVHIADIDGDGDMDLASASHYDDKIAWYENTNGDGSAWKARNVTTDADGAYSVHIADIDGDGDMDLASASSNDDKIAWYENTNGDGSSWELHVATTKADGASSVYIVDIDGDGKMDLASASHNDGKIAWYKEATCITDPLIANLDAEATQ